MPDMLEQLYCSQQIHIPPTFPSILKLYAKAAIRTQPSDLLRWSAAYFRALAEGELPPVKLRMEYPPMTTPSGLTPGFLKVLIKQLGHSGTVEYRLLLKKWEGICLNVECLQAMLRVGELEDEVDMLKFIGIAAGHLTKTLTQTMDLVCEVLTEEPDGGSDMIPVEIFAEVYPFLARLNCGTPEDGLPSDDEEEEEVAEEEAEEEVVDEYEECKELLARRAPPEEVGEEEVGEDEYPEIMGEEEEEEVKKDEAVQISEEELKATIVPPPPPRLTPQEAVDVPGIGPIISKKQIKAVLEYMEYWGERQEGMIMPRNIHHFLCPPLDKVPTNPEVEQ